jgi:hypothetical protein
MSNDSLEIIDASSFAEEKNKDPFFSPESHSMNVGIAVATKNVYAALIFNHIFFWLQQNKQRGHNQINNQTWMYDSMPDIQKHFPYLSHQQVRDGISALVYNNYLIKAKFSRASMDNRNWYALFNEEWLDTQKMFTKRSTDPIVPVCRPDGTVPQTRSYNDTHDNTHDNNNNMSGLTAERVSSSFFDRLKESNPKIRKPNIDQWAKELQVLSKDGEGNSMEEIEKVICYVLSTRDRPSSNGFCWANVILSPTSLRRNYAKIWAEMQQKPLDSAECARTHNIKWLKKVWDIFKDRPQNDIRLEKNGLEFINGPSEVVVVNFEDKQFVSKTMGQLRKRGINCEG